MNLINLPMAGSAVVRKMAKGADTSTTGKGGVGGGGASAPKPKPVDVTLQVKKELCSVSSLGIQLKPGELKKLLMDQRLQKPEMEAGKRQMIQ